MLNLAIIGCGNIANFHVPAMKLAGFNVSSVSGRNGSYDYLKNFCNSHSLNEVKIFDSSEELLDTNNWDALLISCPTDSIIKYLKVAVTKNKPILVEKPVSKISNELKNFFEFENLRVAYNRRFYGTVKAAKKFFKENKNSIVKVTIPESSDEKYNTQFFPERLPSNTYENSVHMADLIRYIFGDIEWNYKKSISQNNNYKKIIGFGTSTSGSSIILDSCYNSSENFSIEMISGRKRLQLKPIECLNFFDGMEVVHPTEEIPIRTYTPILKERILEKDENNIKLGFSEQSQDFLDFCKGKKSKAARIEDSYKALRLLEDLK